MTFKEVIKVYLKSLYGKIHITFLLGIAVFFLLILTSCTPRFYSPMKHTANIILPEYKVLVNESKSYTKEQKERRVRLANSIIANYEHYER